VTSGIWITRSLYLEFAE